MKLEQQVTSLEIAKRLKELGVKQESYFYHVQFNVGEREGGEKSFLMDERQIKKPLTNDAFSAFTVAELGQTVKDYQSQQQIQHHADVGARGNYLFDADYWAEVLIMVLENNHVKV